MIQCNRDILAAITIACCLGLIGCDETEQTTPLPTERELSASDSFDARIRNNPQDPAVYAARAEFKLSEGDTAGALEDWSLALRADSNYAPAWEMQSEVLYQLRQFEPCLEKLEGCLQRFPDDVACLMRRAEFAIHLNQFEEAFDWLNSALRVDDQLHEAYWMKGRIYETTGALEKAQSSYQTAVEVNPDFFDGFIALGILLASQQNPLAEEYYQSAMELRPQAVEPLYNLAIFLQDSDRHREALNLYERILTLDSQNATASFNQGYIHLEYLQSYDSAAYWFSEAIERLPYYHQAFYNRGLARESMGQVQIALEDYTEALRLKPDYTAAAKAKGRALKSNKGS
jgi:tetratricopeptide (TPR) repeat protein